MIGNANSRLTEAKHTNTTSLNRVITLPMLIFYGVGVTVGAGIFALSGEVVGLAGNQAPLAFLIAAIIAGITAVSYAVQSKDAPKAAGEALYIRLAFGNTLSVGVGLLLVVSAIFSSAAIAVSFSNYMQHMLPIPASALILMSITLITFVACKGIKETVVFAAIITLIEVGALLAVIVVGLPQVIDSQSIVATLMPEGNFAAMAPILSGAVIAFFAFIGFEDIVNMGEETVQANRNLPIAIMATLGITLLIYLLVSIVCVFIPDRAAFLSSTAPLAYVFESSTGYNPWIISFCAAIAMINGILVQIVMSSRVLYGLAQANSLPSILGTVNTRTQTPVTAILLVAVLVGLLALTFSLVHLATYSSVVLLIVFSAVNLALWKRGKSDPKSSFARWSNWGFMGFIACFSLLAWQIFNTSSSVLH